MDVACPVLPSQHAEYASDGTVGRQYRLPLQEATGNVQNTANSSNSSNICSPVIDVASSSSSNHNSTSTAVSCTPTAPIPTTSIPTPPTLPTMPITQLDGHSHTNAYQGNYYPEAKRFHQIYSHNNHEQQQQQLIPRRSSIRPESYGLGVTELANPNNVNPIYLSPQFQAYRRKQAEKDDKTEQIWPNVLEDAFLDALLLIPQMGRKKYAMRGQLHGRNMLISEYLWVAYCRSLPDGVKPDQKMARGRKQVSSHIQVLKNFFIHHRCYHFFFPSKERKDDNRKDYAEKESFKDNPVLRALFEGRLPAERPNYEYFGQLLASDAKVAVRPNLCWILVSSAGVRYEADGTRRGQAIQSDGMVLDSRQYPHLYLNLKRDEWPEHGKIIRGTLLQEYTRILTQKEASSVREITEDWEERFPGSPLVEALEDVVRQDLPDILHFNVTLDVQEPNRFPDGAELNSMVEVTLEQPALRQHRWKSVTRLLRPWELITGAHSDSTPPVAVITREINNQYAHRPSCHVLNGGGHAGSCDCFTGSVMHRQTLSVPFPATEWATMLSMLAVHKRHPLEQDASGNSASSASYGNKRSSYGSTTTATTGSGTVADDEAGEDSFVSATDSNASDVPAPTQMDLVRNIAMLQELWSCGPPSAMDPAGSPQWVRRVVIIWTFETVYSINEKKMTVVKSPSGTSWRFLTTIDPTSEIHQQNVLVTPTNDGNANKEIMSIAPPPPPPPPPAAYRPHQQQQQTLYSQAPGTRSIMSPHPGYQQHLQAAMSEHLTTTWNPMGATNNVATAANVSNVGVGYPTGIYRQNPILSSPVAPVTVSGPTATAYDIPSPISLLDTTYDGLDTTPPSASLPYFDNHQTQQPQQTQHTQLPQPLPSFPRLPQPAYQQQQQQQQQQPQQQQLPQPQTYDTQLNFLPGAGTEAVVAAMQHQQQQRQPSIIDPFLANGSGAGGNGMVWPEPTVQQGQTPSPASSHASHPLSGTHHTSSQVPTAHMSRQTSPFGLAQRPQQRGQKRGRSDSDDDTQYPVASIPKLSHNGFSNWRQ